jgi:HD-GYP domain-containing protein (c-di-GMP phosphodiesterase class II)
MRVVSVDKLSPGQIVGRPLLDTDGNILLNQDVALTDAYIRAVQSKGFTRIYIKDPDAFEEVELDEDLDPVTRAKAIGALKETFKSIEHQLPPLQKLQQSKLEDVCKSETMRALMGSKGVLGDVHEAVSAILEEVLTRSTLAGLVTIRNSDTKQHEHAIDVCVVSVMIGRALRLPYARLKQLATGCLLHDIGKIFVDPAADPIRKVRQHTLLGYELLKNNEDSDILAPHVALEHHERQDGSGEPRALIGSNTVERDRSLPPPVPTLIGEVAAVANLYDNLLAGSAEQAPMTPDAAIPVIRNAAGAHLNQEIVQKFVEVTPVFPRGAEVFVRAGDYRGCIAFVSEVHREALDRPTIIIFKDQRGQPVAPIEVNLREEADVELRLITDEG